MALATPRVTILGPDPAHRTYILNGNAFQQDAITTLNGWQYAVFYASLQGSNPASDLEQRETSSTSTPEEPGPEPLYVHLARRKLPSAPWQTIVFRDYPQTTDDGHNTVQLGLCAGDGTIHLSWDHHCDVLRYRYSIRGLASDAEAFTERWAAASAAEDLFTPPLDHLPGLPAAHTHFGYVTYPRFGPLGKPFDAAVGKESGISSGAPQDMWFSFRTGKAGLGNDHLYAYSARDGFYRRVGTHLIGVECNPYVHGLDYRDGRLHTTWVNRGFIWYEGWDDPLDTKHKRQAGPNATENNHNICYAYSEDGGYTWRNSTGVVIASLHEDPEKGIRPDAEGVVVFEIPKKHGLVNQEAQAVDQDGGVHVLNRDIMDGEHLWKHYYRSHDGTWSQRALQPIKDNTRGRLAISKDGDLYIILPSKATSTISILKASKDSKYSKYEEVWSGSGLTGEPLVDTPRLEVDNVLSVFMRQDADGSPDKKNVVVFDFQL